MASLLTRTPTCLVTRQCALPKPSALAAPRSRRTAIKTSALLDFLKPKGKASRKPKRETVVLEPSYNLQAGLAAIAGLEAYEGIIPLAAFTGFLAAFLTFQATRLRFVFDDEALEIRKDGQESENVLVGGENRWPYKAFINWEFWWPAFPVLVYFKEDQTKPEGQVHFFPIIFNGKQLYEVMKERCGPSQNSA
ncbi:hypothetical protein DUNSADRAFT_14981 [Dunaliella salina]|uniref:Uncharacterized protein n=1 Tax=Dunaliella salina TaxID=3046 RepID=A0ABQ7H284_DUNSA|nr:hypothetical protein DUNSADRAFT_14981 [Dunaliella salina]|eukprot:KAF5840957.1 hypothetical protein DUNSADRAFT_14981 [Dunaliella salina]